jgi:hypothetical protein
METGVHDNSAQEIGTWRTGSRRAGNMKIGLRRTEGPRAGKRRQGEGGERRPENSVHDPGQKENRIKEYMKKRIGEQEPGNRSAEWERQGGKGREAGE